jgi:hypothetical protein
MSWPKYEDGRFKRWITVRMDESLFKKLKKIAWRSRKLYGERIPVSTIVRIALIHEIRRLEKENGPI